MSMNMKTMPLHVLQVYGALTDINNLAYNSIILQQCAQWNMSTWMQYIYTRSVDAIWVSVHMPHLTS